MDHGRHLGCEWRLCHAVAGITGNSGVYCLGMLDAFPHVQPVLHAIAAAGGRPQIVGGAVRDLLRGEAVKDVDIEVYGLAIDRLVELLGRFGRVDAVGRSFGVLKLRLPDGQELDIALPRRESKIGAGHRGFLAAPDPTMTPREAAARRDFTWNALALTHTGELLDFFGGVADLEAGIIRHTTEAFAEDPLRVLRAMQLAARLDMRLAPETAELSRALLPEAATLAVERIWGEWQKWALKSTNPAAGLRVLAETGWIALYPELEELIGCSQDPLWHPEGWSIIQLPGNTGHAGTAQPVDINVALPAHSFREFVTRTSAAAAVIPRARGTSSAQTTVDAMSDGLSTADPTRADRFSSPSSLIPATTTDPKGLVWSFATPTISADEVLRVVFQVPLHYVKSVMLSAVDDFEIVRRIVHPIAIYVMNMLVSFQRTAELQFHHNAMDGDRPILTRPGSVHIPTIIVDARSATIDGNVLFNFDLAVVRDADIAHTFDYSTRLRVFQVEFGDVWTHTLQVCNAAARIAARDRLGGEERVVLLFAALCHDLGKPATTEVGEDGRIRSPGHARAGVAPTEALLRRIGCPRAIVEQVVMLVDTHMAHHGMDVTPRAVQRLAVRLAPATLAEWARMLEADASGRPPLPPSTPGASFLALAEQLGAAHGRPAPILQGRHLLEVGMAPGPKLGALLRRAYQAQIDGAFATVDEALEWVARQPTD